MNDIKLMKITTLEQLKAISDPLRVDVLEIITHEALTVKQMAEKLNQPPTKLYYQVSELETAGFVTLVGTRIKSGIIEKYYRTVSESIQVDRTLLNEECLPGLLCRTPTKNPGA
jgi:DNA-binding transcriptional ArsR family regulator